MKAYVKVHNASGDVIVAACDECHIGKEYKEGKMCLHVNKSFYKGRLIDVDDLGRYFNVATIINLVGDDCIAKGCELGVVDPACVIIIEGVKHAQMVTV